MTAMTAYDSWDQGWGNESTLAPNGDPQGDSYLDPGVYEIVWGLYEAGIETGWSCQGGGRVNAHGRLERTVAILPFDDEDAGPQALEVALRLKMPVLHLHKVISSEDGRFFWELYFDHQTDWRRPTPTTPTEDAPSSQETKP